MSQPTKNAGTTLEQKIGTRIMLLRGDESQSQLAEAVGVSREIIQHWERGTRHIKAVHLIALAEHFHVTTDYLLGLSETKTNDRDIAAIGDYTGLDEESISNLHAFRSYPAITHFLNGITQYRNLFNLYSLFYAAALAKQLDKSEPEQRAKKKRSPPRSWIKAKEFDSGSGEITLSADMACRYLSESARKKASDIADLAAASAIGKAGQELKRMSTSDFENSIPRFIQFLEQAGILESEDQHEDP